ncbi:uncharacterized protein LOC119109033 [Pollicipes pollicipes]|uniref:uncharacterized protein LOC119109033 n=1 Tax=Pollicipes pollicipes TaxID=41117 RepID=UPI001885063C|nr:uncharacterized protein LOC119109033 [Pollicipes pollicipes]
MHPAGTRGVAMVPDVPHMSLAFGEPTAGLRVVETTWRPESTVLLEPARECWRRLRPESCAPPVQTSTYPGRAVPCAAPLRSSRVSSSSDAKDLSQPLFVDTTVEYDLPKEAYPPEHSEPLLIVHPQYFEHLRHRRTLGAGCVCQLCNFYGRRIPHGGQEPAPSAAPAAAAAPVAPETFQKPDAPHHWPRYHQPHQPPCQLLHQATHPSLQQPLQHVAPQSLQPVQQQLLPTPARYNCMLERYGCEAGRGAPASFVTPTVSCDSDSGYSSVELEPPEWCQRLQQQQQRADSDARDVLAKRKRRTDVSQPAAKRLRVAYWPGGVPTLDMVPYLHRQPAVM